MEEKTKDSKDYSKIFYIQRIQEREKKEKGKNYHRRVNRWFRWRWIQSLNPKNSFCAQHFDMSWQNVIPLRIKNLSKKLPRRKDNLSLWEWKSQILAFSLEHRTWKGNGTRLKKITDNLITRYFQACEDSEVYLKCTLSKEWTCIFLISIPSKQKRRSPRAPQNSNSQFKRAKKRNFRMTAT